MTQNVMCTIEQISQTFFENHVACRLALIHFYSRFKPAI